MNDLPNPLTDAERELRILEIGESLVHVHSISARRSLWREMRGLILNRSAQQVARMEKQKGLR